MQKSKTPTVKNQYASIPNSLVTRDVDKYVQPTGNLYETLNIMAQYANQVGINIKNEINEKLAEFGTGPDNLEEIHENREQIEISKMYERMPKPTQISLNDMLDGKIYWRYRDEETTSAE